MKEPTNSELNSKLQFFKKTPPESENLPRGPQSHSDFKMVVCKQSLEESKSSGKLDLNAIVEETILSKKGHRRLTGKEKRALEAFFVTK